MERRKRTWTKNKLLADPDGHPVLSVWKVPAYEAIFEDRDELGLFFNELRYLLSKDYSEIRNLPPSVLRLKKASLTKTREYNDYTILQKDLSRLCDLGYLKKEQRGYYVLVENPVAHHIKRLNEAAPTLIGAMKNVQVIATESLNLPEDSKKDVETLYSKLREEKAALIEPSLMEFWGGIDKSKLDLPQKIILKIRMEPLRKSPLLRRIIRRKLLITFNNGKRSYDIPASRRRNPEKLEQFIKIVQKHERLLGSFSTDFALGMYSYPDIFTEQYITKKGESLRDKLSVPLEQLSLILREYAKPLYIILSPPDDAT